MEALDLATSDTQTRLAKVAQVDEELKRVYKNKIFPLEHHYCYDKLFSDPISGAEFDATPQVLLLGQYSTGLVLLFSTILKNVSHFQWLSCMCIYSRKTTVCTYIAPDVEFHS